PFSRGNSRTSARKAECGPGNMALLASPPMFHPPIHARVLEELCRAFGQPGANAGNGSVWTLRTSALLAPVCVLLNGTSDHATVWVMDPSDAIGGVCGEVITHEDSIPG